jgi:hypothetical protein
MMMSFIKVIRSRWKLQCLEKKKKILLFNKLIIIVLLGNPWLIRKWNRIRNCLIIMWGRVLSKRNSCNSLLILSLLRRKWFIRKDLNNHRLKVAIGCMLLISLLISNKRNYLWKSLWDSYQIMLEKLNK